MATFRTQTRCYFGHSIGVLSFVAQLRYVDKKKLLSKLGPRRFTNVFDESKINRVRIFAIFWTEYNDSLAYSKYPSDNRSAHRGNPVACLKLRNLTIHLLSFLAFAVALTFIMLFIFNLIIRPSIFFRFSSPLQCHFECFSDRVQRINIRVICFPINAPGMSCFKLFDLVG